MRTAIAIAVGAGVLSLGVDSGMAAVRHHYRHHHAIYRAHVAQIPAQQAQASDLITIGNNPAKRYPARQLSDGAVKTSTLYAAGNNPAKAYPVRHASPDAVREPTLMNSGNNPAKRALVASAH
jgi:hypothetical protein